MIIVQFLQQLATNHFPRDEHIRLGWWMLSMPMLVAIVLHTPLAVVRHRREPGRMVVYSAVLFLATFGGADVVYYAEGAYARATVNPAECRLNSQLPFGSYEALVCVTEGSYKNVNIGGFVRLRSTADGTVLAEREFYNTEITYVHWGRDTLTVGIAEGSAKIPLPPTKWDRLRAMLP
ncbi:MAG: hypothetical protein JWQ88_409 [Rhodoferax sp.]|nr:hypothetical protein [Rhodoferax sp.]